ncbi:nicotinate-nucleotide--dimethylbenzimidazole phosphoribosyltransferase [Ilyobacter sp.]|uniref:nicotinate-nucleotide--dimethylbenzimidazole phosphoribosyltransferase n=1 Tax=Ilyobacter sp. TaxID=3100343 RepID=UPI00356B232B
MELFEETLRNIEGLDKDAVKRAQKRLDSRMKPKGSLGKLEEIAVQFAGITGKVFNSADRRCHIVASADNGVIEEGVSSCPLEYTGIVSEAMLNEIAAIGILCRSVGVDFKLIDIGIKGGIKRDYPNLHNHKVKNGTANLKNEPAMTREECIEAIETGIRTINNLKDSYDIFSNGEMGIANTTTSSAVLYAFTDEDMELIVGRGGGLSDEGLLKKKNIIKEACELHRVKEIDPVDVVARVGGLDIACMIGMYLGAAAAKKPMLVDGFISGVAALAAAKIAPLSKDYMIATHKSEEPGMKVVLDSLQLEAMLHMNMRLGEGTGAVLTYPIITGALEIIKKMKKVDEVYELFA